ncbi:MAG: hypothetical protein HZB38_04190, partial [Planctomycetes bacterium]|nr:hypothetical protein [Planctomycetota bacterium]
MNAPPVSILSGEPLGTIAPNAVDPSDESFVRRVRDGERNAFDALVERYQKRATSVSYRLVGNIHDALEVVQDAFVRAYRSIESLEEPARFGPWLLKIVTNLSLNFRRDRAVGGPKLSLADAAGEDEGGTESRLADPTSSRELPGAEAAASEL